MPIASPIITVPLATDAGAFLKRHIVAFFMPNGMTPALWAQRVNGAAVNVQGHRPSIFQVTQVANANVHHRGRVYGWSGGGNFYQVSPNGAGDGTAYFLPWNVDSAYSLVIGNNASLFFNALMNGCSFGWNPGNGTVRVAHHNIRSSQGSTDNAAMLDAMSGYQGRLMRDDYRNLANGSGQATVIGVRVNGQWQIWSQVFSRPSPGRYNILSVRRLL